MNDMEFTEMKIMKSFPDTRKMTVDFRTKKSDDEILEKGLELALPFHAQLLKVDFNNCRHVDFYFSKTAKEFISKISKGEKLSIVTRNVAGDIIPELTVKGTIFDNNINFILGNACIRICLSEEEGFIYMQEIWDFIFNEEGGKK